MEGLKCAGSSEEKRSAQGESKQAEDECLSSSHAVLDESTMRCAIMSDAHSNSAALKVAIGDTRARGCKRFLMLGDTTGYGYDVNGALQLVKDAFDIVLIRPQRLEVT